MPTPNLLAIKTVTPAVLVSLSAGVTTENVVYTVATNHAVKLAQGTLCNTSGGAVTVGLSIIPSGGSADQTHKIVPDSYSLGAGDTLPLGEFLKDHMLGDGDAIAVHASVANVIDVVISGVVMS